MQTGNRTYRQIERKPKRSNKVRISKARRTSAKNKIASMRLKGLLP